MLRAWWHDHQAGPSLIATAVALTVGTLFATVAVPDWDAGPGLPMWALVPGTVSMLQAPVALSQLSSFDALHPGPAQVRARAAWAAATAVAAALATVPVASAVGQAVVAPLTGLLVACTFALTTWAGMAASLLGATIDVLAFTYASRIAWIDLRYWISVLVPGAGLIAAVLAASAVATYAARGPRAARP